MKYNVFGKRINTLTMALLIAIVVSCTLGLVFLALTTHSAVLMLSLCFTGLVAIIWGILKMTE